jgi:hypothetical protein
MIRTRILVPVIVALLIAAAFFAGYFYARPSSTARPCVDAIKTGASDAADRCRDALGNAIRP